jgi:hypothetical protein
LKLKGSQETLLDCPESEFFSGLSRQRPLFFEGLVDARKSSYRNFQNLSDLELSAQLLDQIEILSRSFWDLLEEPGKQVIGDWPVGVNLTLNEICFSQLFNTALLNCLLHKSFVVEFLDPEEVLSVLSSAVELQGGTTSFQKWLISQAEAHIVARIGKQQDRIVLISFSTKWVGAFLAEFLPLVHSNKIDARFLKSALLRVNPK